MTEHDNLQRFLFEHATIRGEIVHLDTTYQTILGQHPYPPGVKTLLAEALLACVLLTASIKFEGEVSLQFHGDERLPLLLVQCNHLLQVRAFAKYKEDDGNIDYAAAFLQGKMVFNLQQHQQTQSYQSVVPIGSSSMSENLMHYFAQSEQLATHVHFVVSENQAAGIMLQLMPEQNSLQREQFWQYAVVLGQTLTAEELLKLDNQTILHRLYHETELRLYEARPVRFQCRCTTEKMKQVLSVLGEQDVKTLLEEKGQVEVRCDFCNQAYSFDSIDVALMFRH
jgi:molecular chaperone Hsp33